MNLCKHGHGMTPENTYTDPSGKGWCRECRRNARRRSEARKAAGTPFRDGRCQAGLHDLNDPANQRIQRNGRGRACAPCATEADARYRLDVKRAAMGAYGSVCYCCGESELAFLTLDHLNDDGGGRHRERGGNQFYRWLKSHDYPQDLGLAVACFNCNSGRAANGGVCPHQTSGRHAGDTAGQVPDIHAW